MSKENEFLGRGWAFPPTFRSGSSGVDMVSGREDIDQSLEILLSTTLGERVLQPRYGCNLSAYQFEAMNASLIGLLRDVVESAILYHEPRIRTENVSITEDTSLAAIEGKVIIQVDYLIRATNSRYNFVFPFYLNEGVRR